jgi:hypothetical protein
LLADQDHVAILRRDRPLGDGHVVGERRRRVLDDGDLIAVLLQDGVDAVPAGAVHETAVHKHDILSCRHVISSPCATIIVATATLDGPEPP